MPAWRIENSKILQFSKNGHFQGSKVDYETATDVNFDALFLKIQ
ncbi:hypothetical protein C943_04597 [Mariniradius saccharolyticus AK6]|uniref:Uncharacterized protein n=1 Tax=Mariniradius saccharolyticus AK6 TaxID=1239962 RepID=M7XGP5_9BACT|nr:hypothetical protein C943_04597 [Mariniradius saccharolyticus AK6]